MLFDVLIVIIKQGPPRAVPNMENVVITQEQLVQEERQYAGPANTDNDQVNDDMQLDDDHDDNIIEDDGANALINDAFNVRMDDDQHHAPPIDDHNVTQEDVEELVEADDVSDNVHHDEDDYIDDDDDDIAFNSYNVEFGLDDIDGDDDEVH